MTTKLRILLADDHETVREGLKAILNSQHDMEVVAEAADGRAAINSAAHVRPDIVVMDVSMPDVSGLSATEIIRKTLPHIKVLTLSRHSEDGYLQQLLRAGASGYVLKQSRSTEVLHAIRTIARGGTYVDPALARRTDGRRGVPSAAPAEAARHAAITAREEEVLRLAAWGYSNKEIAARLDVSVKTIETHKANASSKLGLSTRMEIVSYALLQGWLRET
jgi:DNA-binding NarL/FixJ family response regulator